MKIFYKLMISEIKKIWKKNIKEKPNFIKNILN